MSGELRDAVLAGNFWKVQGLLFRGNLEIDILDDEGFSCLHHAVVLENVKITRALLAAGANPTLRIGRAENSPNSLHLAASCKTSELILEILNHAQSNNISIDLNEVCFCGGPEHSILLPPLLIAADHENPAIAKELLLAGADVNLTNLDGLNTLHTCCLYNRDSADEWLDLMDIALKMGADVTAKGPSFPIDEYLLPLHFAVDSDNSGFIGLLVQYGADVDARDDQGNTPLLRAVSNSLMDLDENCEYENGKVTSCSTVAALIKAGADVLAQNTNKQTALQLVHSTFISSTVENLLGKNGLTDCRALINEIACSKLLISDREMRSKAPIIVHLVAAGDHHWAYVPYSCPGLEASMYQIWKKVPQDLGKLFRRLTPEVKKKIQMALRCLHPYVPAPGNEYLRIAIITAAFEARELV